MLKFRNRHSWRFLNWTIDLSQYPKRFWKLCLACLLFFSSFTMVLPDLPQWLKSIGGAGYEWLIIPSFAFIALLLRPISGKLADQKGRVVVMVIGAVAATLASSLYLVLPFVALFFMIRGLHGFCAGFSPTGFTAYADDIVPLEKRGEAMGIIGICNNVGNAIGWLMGSHITEAYGLQTMFVCSAVLGISATMMFWSLPETLKNKQAFKFSELTFNPKSLLEFNVYLPAIIMLLTAYASGSILALIADYTKSVGIHNKGMYMAVYIASSLVIRFMAGRWSDRFGRQRIASYGVYALALSMFLLVFSEWPITYYLSSVCFGLGFGLISPALFAWAADLSRPGLKGKAFGTLYIFLELGIILGSGISGWLYNNLNHEFSLAFILAGCMALISHLMMILLPVKKITP
jgi:MFS family permease